MTTYSTILNSEIDPDSPITTALMTKIRDNPLAIGEGASGAPKLLRNAMRVAYFSASGTFNVPADVTQVWVEVAGAGGGGAGHNTSIATAGSAGGSSSFGAFCSATGGAGGTTWNGTIQTVAGPLHGLGSGGDINLRGSGGDGGMNTIGQLTPSRMYTPGGNGGKSIETVAVTPSAAITVTIGAGGAGGVGSGDGLAGQDGSDGWCKVLY